VGKESIRKENRDKNLVCEHSGMS